MKETKYSIKDLKSRKDGKCWVVQIENREQYNFLLSYFPNMWKYISNIDGYLVDLTNSGLSEFNHYSDKEYNKITINQIKEYIIKEKEQFPKDDFGVIIENGNEKKILNYLISKGFKNINDSKLIEVKNGGTYSIFKNQKYISYTAPGFSSLDKRYTLEQLKQLDSNNMEKKISAYQVKSKYSTVASKISIGGTRFVPNSATYNQFLELGVLDIWFEVEYEPEKPKEKVISMGEFSLTVKSEGIFHKSENITEYVERINTWWKNVMNEGNLKFGNKAYDFLIPASNITLMKTGCENKQSNLNSWLTVWKEYQLIKG